LNDKRRTKNWPDVDFEFASARRQRRPEALQPGAESRGRQGQDPGSPRLGVRINPAWLEKAAYQKSERPSKS
jgi:hypothetical protein